MSAIYPDDVRDLKPLALGEKVKAIAMNDNSACALLVSGLVKCWGSNKYGQLGSGDSRSSIGLEAGDMKSIRAVLLNGKATAIAAAKEERFCAIVPTVLGSSNTPTNLMKCWGENDNGELGTGDINSRGLVDRGDAEPIPPALVFKSTPAKVAPK